MQEGNRYLQVCFNEHTGTTPFALIEGEKHMWGDYDDRRGRPLHPVEHPTRHEEGEPMSPHDAVEALAEVWGRLS